MQLVGSEDHIEHGSSFYLSWTSHLSQKSTKLEGERDKRHVALLMTLFPLPQAMDSPEPPFCALIEPMSLEHRVVGTR